MSQVTPFTQNYSYQSELGTTFGTHLDSEFTELASVTLQIATNLALIQRDDGMVRNQTVHANAFDSSALALIAGEQNSDALRWTPRGSWVTLTSYAVTDIVETGSPATAYVCAVAHTAGVFATDYAAGKWVILSAPRSLISADVTTALGFTPVNKAGDTMTGALVAPTSTKISGVTFTDTYLATQDLVRHDKGLFANYSSSKSGIIYGYAANIFRTGGAYLTVGAQISALDTNSAAVGAWGVATEAWNLNSDTSGIIGIEATPVSTRPANSGGSKIGMLLTFKNRGDGQTIAGAYSVSTPGGNFSSPGAGTGSNYYNSGAYGIYIDSQQPAGGENCGWHKGIMFAEYAMARSKYDPVISTAVDTGAIGIDFSNLHYYGGTVPVVAYQMEAAIALRDIQPIWWNRNPLTPTTVTQVLTYFDPTVGRWKLTNGGVEKFGIDATTGALYVAGVPLSSSVSLSGNNVFTGTNTFNAAVTIGSNLTFSGTGRRIQAQFNGTVTDRALFQTSSLNTDTEVGVIPNGTAVGAGFYLLSGSDATNGSLFRVAVDNANATIVSDKLGTGSYVPLEFFVSGSERMRISATNGQVLVNTTSESSVSGAKLRVNGIIVCDQPVAFAANCNNVNFNVADGTPTKIPATTEEFDTNGSYTAATARFTPPAGKYALHACTRLLGSSVNLGNVVICSIYKNGAQHKSGSFSLSSAASQSTGSTVSCIVDANGTDYFEAFATQVSSAPATIAFCGLNTDTWFQGNRIG